MIDTDTDDIVSDIEKVNQGMIRILLAGAPNLVKHTQKHGKTRALTAFLSLP